MWSGRVTSQKRKYDQFEHLAEAEEQACTEMGKQLTAMTNSLSEIGTRLPSAHAIHRCVQDLNAACAERPAPHLRDGHCLPSQLARVHETCVEASLDVRSTRRAELAREVHLWVGG